MALDLSRVGKRSELKARREPYWQRLRTGCYIGFRPSKRSGPGTWIARAYNEDSGKYRIKSLGDFGTLPANEVFAASKKEAEAFADVIESGGRRAEKVETVLDACRAYLEAKQNASGAKGMLKRHVFSDPIAVVKIDKLRRHHVAEWRKRLEAKPAPITRNKGGETRTRPRSSASVNRDMVPLRAALTLVLAPGAPNTDAAWQEALKPIKNADKQRTLYLDIEQRRKIAAAVEEEAAPFVKALGTLPLRPGALAHLRAGDFDKRTRELTVGKDKNGKPRRILVPDAVSTFLAEQTKNKLPAAPMFMRSNGACWTKEDWNDPLKAACRELGLAAAVTAYTFRHSVITDLVNGGLALLTVAQISDTSVEMIERHYGHLNRAAAEQALAALAL